MPELPEVETIRLGLQKYIVGKTIADVEVRLKKIVSGDTKNIIGARVVDIRRFGKGLVIDLSNNYSIAIHIKMTGQLIYKGTDVPKETKETEVAKDKIGGELPNKWTHVIFKLKAPHFAKASRGKQNAHLYYNDLRQFGWIKIVKTDEIQTLPFFKELGPEPPVLSDYSSSNPSSSGKSRRRFWTSQNDGSRPIRQAQGGQARTILTPELFKQIVSRSNLAIKVLIMDQKKMSGVGNIYANDGLFEARIDPKRSAKQISDDETKRLYNSILKVLKKGLESGGASELSFVNVLGQDGGYQKHFLVYGREKEPCRICKNPIQKIKLGGRGTYFCEKCQK